MTGGTFCEVSGVSLLRRTLINARSVCNKLPDIHSILYSGDVDIVLITESWLNDNVTNGLLDPEARYNIIRCDRKNAIGGGVCILLSKTLDIVEIPLTKHFPQLEAACVDIFTGNTRCRIFNIYRRPHRDHTTGVAAMEQLITCLERFCDTRYPCIITGDLNCPLINWSDCSAPRGSIYETIRDFATSNGFVQLVSEPTTQAIGTISRTKMLMRCVSLSATVLLAL